jgi:hypothetical protein
MDGMFIGHIMYLDFMYPMRNPTFGESLGDFCGPEVNSM